VTGLVSRFEEAQRYFLVFPGIHVGFLWHVLCRQFELVGSEQGEIVPETALGSQRIQGPATVGAIFEMRGQPGLLPRR
jgi:hypothetical protein